MVEDSINFVDRMYEEMNEETVCARVVVPYIRYEMEWNIMDIYAEYKLHSSGKKVDYALGDRDNPRILVEVKAPDKNLGRCESQLSSYLDLSDTNLGILTNGMEYRIMERNEGDRNQVIEKFNVADKPPERVRSNTEHRDRTRTTCDFAEDMKENYESSLPQRVAESLILQYHTRGNFSQCVHIYFSGDRLVCDRLVQFVRDQYESVTYVKEYDIGKEVVDSSRDASILVYDNSDSSEEVTRQNIRSAFSCEATDDLSGLPEDKPMLVIDTPNDDS